MGLGKINPPWIPDFQLSKKIKKHMQIVSWISDVTYHKCKVWTILNANIEICNVFQSKGVIVSSLKLIKL